MARSQDDVEDVNVDQSEAADRLSRMLEQGRSYSGRERNCCFLNTNSDERAQHAFANVSAASGLDHINDSRSIGLVDWDHDGDQDVWVSHRNAPRLRLMRNETNSDSAETQNHFVSFSLQGNGKDTNRDAIGARIELVFEDENVPPIHRTLRAGEGFISQSSKRMTIGLGQVTKLKSAIVHWPNANEAEEFNLEKVNEHYQLVQGSGDAKPIDSQRKVALRESVPKELKPKIDSRILLQTRLAAPEIQYESSDGFPKIKTHLQKNLLVTLWSQTCDTCRHELVQLSKAAEKLNQSNIDVLLLSVDDMLDTGDPEIATAFVEKIKSPFDSGFATQKLLDRFQELYDSLMSLDRPLPVPCSLLIDERGKLIAIYKGVVRIENLVSDVLEKETETMTRFERSAALPGRVTGVEEINDAIVWQEVATRGIYANRLLRRGLKEQASDELLAILKIKPGLGYAHRKLAQIRADQNRLIEAKRHYEEVLKSNSEKKAEVHTSLGDLYIRENKLKPALPHFEKAIELKPESSEFQFNLGSLLVNMNEHDRAIEHFERALKLKPNFAEAANGIGTVYFLKKDPENAKASYAKAIKIKANYAEAHFNLGNVFAVEKDYERAKICYQQTLSIQATHREAQVRLQKVEQLLQAQ